MDLRSQIPKILSFGLAPKLMGISYNLREVHFFLIIGPNREIFPIMKGGVDHFLIVS